MPTTSLTDITAQVRYLINDLPKSGIDIFTYGSSAVFTLTECNPIAITDVSVNDTTSGVSYSYNTSTHKVTLTSSLLSGDTVEVDYTFYQNYSDSEIQNYIYAATYHLSNNNYKKFYIESANYIYPDPHDREVHLIAAITALLINPDNKTVRLPDMTISVPKDLPTHDKISRMISIFKKNSHGIIGTLG